MLFKGHGDGGSSAHNRRAVCNISFLLHCTLDVVSGVHYLGVCKQNIRPMHSTSDLWFVIRWEHCPLSRHVTIARSRLHSNVPIPQTFEDKC